jgi:hypothetical protein
MSIEPIGRKPTEKTRTQRYADSLDRVIQNNYIYLKETTKDFQEKCVRTVSVRTLSKQVAGEIEETHREIQQRLKEIKAIQQLLKTKYLLYARKDPIRDREVAEFEQTAKQCYSKFESSQRQVMEKGRPRHGEAISRAEVKGGAFQWFRDRENQVMLLRNLRILSELDYEISPSKIEEQRQVDHDKPRGLTLFVFRGNPKYIDNLQSRLRLREHDIVERYNKEEIRGVLTHLREINLWEVEKIDIVEHQSKEEIQGALTHTREVSPWEVEKIFERYRDSPGFSELKCLLLPVRPEKGLEGNITDLLEKILDEMAHGEVKTLLIWQASFEPSTKV